MTFKDGMDAVALGFEAFGASVLIVGFGVGLARAGLSMARGEPGGRVYRVLRSFVGRTVLLGLEVLVAADLIRTVAVEPSWESVGMLSVIVAIRTLLSFSLDVETEGRLPWQRSAQPAGSGAIRTAARDGPRAGRDVG